MNVCQAIILAVVTVFVAGCTQLQLLPYLDQALLLQSFGKEKDAQHKYILNADGKFEQLCADIQSGAFQKLTTEKEITQTYGLPVLVSDDQINGEPIKRSLYRYAIQKKSSKKVYLYYDNQGSLVKFDLI